MADKIVEKLYTDRERTLGAVNYNMIEVLDANIHNYPNDPKNRERTGGAQTGFYGILQNNFTYNVQADWEAKLANIDILGTGALGRGAIKAATGDLSRSGIFTEKFYQGASYLVINPKFRVVDWDGNGDVMKTAVKVANKLLPLGNNRTVGEQFGDISNFVNKAVPSVGQGIKNAGAKIIDTVVLAGSDLGAAANNAALGAMNAALGVGNKLLWGEPEPVRVKIGNFFDMNNMILESCSIEFSKEMTKNGPLYADFDVQFSTKLALVKHQTGLIARDGNGQQVRIRGTFAEDRAFPRAEADRWKEYQKNWQPARIEESWLLAKLRDEYGLDPVNATYDAIQSALNQ